jgi:hypothetical protein
MERLLQTLTAELREWRATLETMRETNYEEVDAVIDHLEDSIQSVRALQAADVIGKVMR